MPFPSEGLIGDFSGIIQHEVVKDMLGVTMLIYDYAKKFTMEGGMTIESFVSQRKGEEDNEIDLTLHEQIEFSEWIWSSYWHPINAGVEF